MSAAALTPRVRMMTLCDGVRESKVEAGVFHLKGVRQEISARSFPFVCEQLWVFFLLTSPRAGEFPCYARIVNERSGKAVFFSHIEPCPTFGQDGGSWVYYSPVQCAFPEPGRYFVELWFFQLHGSDVLKGEIPFQVAAEEE